MNFKLVEDWASVAWKSWSARLVALSALLQVAPEVIPYLQGIIPNWVLIALLVAAYAARLIKQDELHPEDLKDAVKTAGK